MSEKPYKYYEEEQEYFIKEKKQEDNDLISNPINIQKKNNINELIPITYKNQYQYF